MYRQVPSAPRSSLDPARRGRAVGQFCKSCRAVYPLLARAHAGKPSFGRDHVASPCAHEGRRFEVGADWWEVAVEVVDAAPASE